MEKLIERNVKKEMLFFNYFECYTKVPACIQGGPRVCFSLFQRFVIAREDDLIRENRVPRHNPCVLFVGCEVMLKDTFLAG